MNNITLAGRIGRDAETRFTHGGTAVTSFSLAVDEYAGKDKERNTLWVDCAIFGERGERLVQYLTKGGSVTISGRAGVRQYESNGETKATLTVAVNEVTLQGSKQNDAQRGGGHGGSRGGAPQRERPGRATDQNQATTFDDDDIPFATNRGNW